MSRLIEFYGGQGADDAGRYFNEVMDFDLDALEHGHDYIQWIFPLPEASRFHPRAPLLTEEDLARFTHPDSVLRTIQARRACILMLNFFMSTTAWRAPKDHNHLRITRILRFLTLIGLDPEARAFLRVAEREAPAVPERTRWYWKEALNKNPAWLEAP